MTESVPLLSPSSDISSPRFEVPFHIICTKCNEMVAKGERFNADKKCIGEALPLI